jgi:hypothetical protein
VRTVLPHSSGDPTSSALLGEAADLLVPDRRLRLPVPAYHGRSLANLAATLWAYLSSADREHAPPMPALRADNDPFRGRRPAGPVILFLVDGLGWTAFRGSAERAPSGVASRWHERAHPITSVFPTTTTVALTSLSSGAAPSQHGVVGHRVFLPRFGTVVEVLRMSPIGVGPGESLVGPNWTPEVVSGVPTIYRRGTPALALTRDRFEGTGFTRMIYDGAAFLPYASGSDLAITLAEVLARPEPPPLLVVYRDDLDVVQHVRGVRPELVDLELERTDHILSFVARHLPPDRARATTLIITGDHGQVPMASDRQLAVDREPLILAHLARPPSGDRRAAYFAARPGHLDALREALELRLPPGGTILEMSSAVEAGLFGPGPYHPELSERLGDLLVLMPSPGGVSYSVPGSPTRAHRMISSHGGLEPDELLVPLIAGTLSELAGELPHLPHQLGAHRPTTEP